MLADKGTAIVNGLDVVTDYKLIRTKVGYMPGRFSLYQDLSVEENLEFFATVFHTSIQENYDLIKDIYQQIEPFKKRRAGALSGGMKQKLAIAQAFMEEPKVLLLDEPMNALDEQSVQDMRIMFREYVNKKPAIMVITSHHKEDIEILCDQVYSIKNGYVNL